jgi:hypothetical protein
MEMNDKVDLPDLDKLPTGSNEWLGWLQNTVATLLEGDAYNA